MKIILGLRHEKTDPLCTLTETWFSDIYQKFRMNWVYQSSLQYALRVYAFIAHKRLAQLWSQVGRSMWYWTRSRSNSVVKNSLWILDKSTVHVLVLFVRRSFCWYEIHDLLGDTNRIHPGRDWNVEINEGFWGISHFLSFSLSLCPRSCCLSWIFRY